MLTLEHSFVKVLEQMSMINFMNYSLSTAAEGFVPSHAPLKNNKHLNIPFQSTQPRRGKDKSELQGLTPSSQVCACRTKRGGCGRASILSVMPNMAPDIFQHPSDHHSNFTCYNAIESLIALENHLSFCHWISLQSVVSSEIYFKPIY